MLEATLEGRWPPVSNPRITPDDGTIVGVVRGAASCFGSSVALTDSRRTWRFDELPSLAARVACYLAARGVSPGDRVVVAGANRSELLELFIGCAWLAAVFVPINPETPPSQIRDLVDYLEPTLAFADESCVAGWRAVFPQVMTIADSDHAPWDHQTDTMQPNPQGRQTTVAILMTSGTTGRSKGVECPNGQFLRWGSSVGDLLNMGSTDVAYTCLPLFHTNALNAFMQTLMAGARLHVGPRFSVSQFLERLVEAEATITYLLGAMVGMLLTRAESAVDREHRVTRILAPGTPVPSVEAFESRFGAILIEGHGMTETNLVIAPPRGERRLGWMGCPVDGFLVRVVDENGMQVPQGVIGELELKALIPATFASGYWRLPEASHGAYRNGWFRTGDRVVEESGWYRFVDRSKDVIRRRGENISAFEVEQALEADPRISRSAVVPVPAEFGEDEVMAYVVLVRDEVATPEEIVNLAAEILPRHALPRYVAFVDDLPLTETGKIRKQLLREQGIIPGTWDRTPDGR